MLNMRFLSVAGLCLCASGALAQTPVLTVYTYDSFATEWGPGPAVETAFEAECGCDLQFVTAGDGAALLSRLQLEGERTDADVVLGLDTALIEAAKETGLFAASGVVRDFDLPVEWTDSTFIPYDWGWFAVVADRETTAPTDFRALGASSIRLVIQDPRSSTPGLGLVMWVKAAYGEDAGQVWSDLADNIVTVTPGWSEAYGMFLEGEADAVLSYTTSPAYHRIAEEDDSKVAWSFTEGHYIQVEVAAKLKGTDQEALADQFLEFMVSDTFQNVIPTTNWMYPAVLPTAGLPEGFAGLVEPAQSLLLSPIQAAQIQEAAIEEWRTALSR